LPTELRSIARQLDARVTGEGEDITDPAPTSSPKRGCMAVIVCVVALLAVIVIAIIGRRWI